MSSLVNCNELVRITDKNGNDPVYMMLRESEMVTSHDCVEVRLRGEISRAEANRIQTGRKESGIQKQVFPAYKQVIFNKPATIVLWQDGTKTVVKCDERDEYDPKYGMALCFMKKALGNRSRALNDVLHDVFPAKEESTSKPDPVEKPQGKKKEKFSFCGRARDLLELTKDIDKALYECFMSTTHGGKDEKKE